MCSGIYKSERRITDFPDGKTENKKKSWYYIFRSFSFTLLCELSIAMTTASWYWDTEKIGKIFHRYSQLMELKRFGCEECEQQEVGYLLPEANSVLWKHNIIQLFELAILFISIQFGWFTISGKLIFCRIVCCCLAGDWRGSSTRSSIVIFQSKDLLVDGGSESDELSNLRRRRRCWGSDSVQFLITYTHTYSLTQSQHARTFAKTVRL